MPLSTILPAAAFVNVTAHDYGRGVGVEISHQELSLSSGTWPANNLAIASPIYLEMGGLVKQFFVNTGAAASGNVDVGLYTSTFARIVSSGGVVQASAGDLQVFDTTDIYVGPGTYYIACALSSTVGTTVRAQNALSQMRAWGVVQMAAAYPLPATFTPATVGQGYLPLMGLTLSTVV